MIKGAEFAQYIQTKGSVAFPCWLLERYQALGLAPEELGYLLLAMYRRQTAPGEGADTKPYSQGQTKSIDPWIGWALDNGWAVWSDAGDERQPVLDPLWQKLYRLWEDEQALLVTENEKEGSDGGGDFDYSRIVKELDHLRGGPTATIGEIRLIQELNLRYGWSSDYIITFFRLCEQRGLLQIRSYKPLAARLYRAGIFTLDGLTDFMNDVDWISKKAAEIKKDYLGLHGMVTIMDRDYYVKWHVTWGFSHAIIARAAKETAGASNATFKYIDAIMQSWRELGVDSLEACEAAISARSSEKQRQNHKRAAYTASTGGAGKGAKDRGQKDSPWSDFDFDAREQDDQRGQSLSDDR